MKQQVLVIHGGDTFKSKDEYLEFLRIVPINIERMKVAGWKENLRSELGADFEVILPQMPNKTNARFEEWKIMFERLLSLLDKELILVGHSMGGTFIAKYLAENDIPNHVRAAFLVAAPFGDNSPEYSLESFSLPADLTGLANQAEKLFILQSTDDPLVPIKDARAYQAALPNAKLLKFTDRGHFSQQHFPELVTEIKRVNGS